MENKNIDYGDKVIVIFIKRDRAIGDEITSKDLELYEMFKKVMGKWGKAEIIRFESFLKMTEKEKKSMEKSLMTYINLNFEIFVFS